VEDLGSFEEGKERWSGEKVKVTGERKAVSGSQMEGD
jgi:hypothetical protein